MNEPMWNQHLERLDLLAPIIQRPAIELVKQCKEKLGRSLLVVRGWSSLNDQMLLWQKGRTLEKETGVWEVTGPIVTKAEPGTSAHNIVRAITGGPASVALDVIPFGDDGKADWEPSRDFWDALYEISWKLGLDPLGDPIGSYYAGDMGHFEEPGWKLKLEGLGLMFPLLKRSEV